MGREQDEAALPRVAHIVDALLGLDKADAEAAVRLYRRRMPAPDLGWLGLVRTRQGRLGQVEEFEYFGLTDFAGAQRAMAWLLEHYPVSIRSKGVGQTLGEAEPAFCEVTVTSSIRIPEIP